MTLIKTSILSAISTVIKVLNGFVLTKIIAVYIGPSGLAFLGQFTNFSSIVMSFATGGINNGIVKYTAEHKEDESVKKRLWSTAMKISVSGTLFISLMLVLFNRELSKMIFKTEEYGSIFLIFAVTLLFFALNSLLLSILNGQKEIKKLITVNITSSFIGLFLTGILTYFYGLYGALISYTTGQALVFFVTLGFVIKSDWFKKELFFDKLDNEYLKKLARYGAMVLTSALLSPISHIVIRNHIGDSITWEAAGIWDGIWRISNTYLMLITTTLSIYYLPRLSEINDSKELRREVIYGYKILIPIAILMAFSIYVFRDFIILLLFTEKFLLMSDLFFYQLLGDVFKIASWILGYLMIAKAMTKMVILVEIIFSLSLVVFTYLLMELYGLEGSAMAFAVNNFVLFVFMLFFFRSMLWIKSKSVNE